MRHTILLPALLLVLALPVAGQTRYIAFGDSITEGAGDSADSEEERGYPPRLEDLLQGQGINAVVENHGLGGETTAGGVTRIDEVLAGGGDVLLLMEGTNDISRRISEETSRFNLSEMARKATEQGLRVVYGSLVPRLPTANTDGSNRATERLAGQVRDLAWSEGRDLADPFEIFITTPDVFDLLYVGGEDRLHPDAEGYDLLAEVFANVVLGFDDVPPVTGLVGPEDGAEDVAADTTVRLNLYDFGSGIDLSSPVLTINGESVEAEVAGDEQRLEISFDPVDLLSGAVAVGVMARDLAAAPNAMDRIVSQFTVEGSDSIAGDIDENGRVDGADLVVFGLRFGTRRGEFRYRAYADFNSDGTIDGEDLAILASNFGQSV